MFEFWDSVINDLILSGRTGYARNNRDTIRFIRKSHKNYFEYAGDQCDLSGQIGQIELFLRSIGGSNGSIAVRMQSIRTMFNLAIRRDLIK